MTDEIRRILPFECRASSDGLTLVGYAAVFGSRTLIDSWEGRFYEEIRRGAFAKTIRETTPVLQFDHGGHPLIGSIPLGAIRKLSEDAHGLHVEARLSDNWLMEPIRDAIRDGAVNGMSFRFRPIKDEWDESGDIPVRTLIEVAMPELGPVVFPAYDATEVGVRDLDLTNLLAARMESRLRAEASTPEPAASGTGEGAAADDEPAPATRSTQAERRQRYRRLWTPTRTTRS